MLNLFGSIVVGVLLSLFFTCLRCDNPLQIPYRQIWLRAFPGMAAFLAAWTIFASLAYLLLSSAIRLAHPQFGQPIESMILAAAVGVILPQLRLPERVVITPERFSGLLRAFSVHCAKFNEVTFRYCDKIVVREERKVTADILKGRVVANPVHLIDRLYEAHKVEIVDAMVKEKGAKALGLLNLRQASSVKCQLLCRHFGVRNAIDRLKGLAVNIDALYPTWPSHLGDRRRNGRRKHNRLFVEPSQHHQTPHGRRRTDSLKSEHLPSSLDA